MLSGEKPDSDGVRQQMQLVQWLSVSCVVVAGVVHGAEKLPPPKSPLNPTAALKEFRLHPGFRIEVAAAEPQVVDPVAVRFDADGRMWVVEMGDYPNGPQPGQPPASRVRWLEDTDGDGRYETSRVFAEGLLFATGLQPWQDGVLVTVAGAVLFLRDTDGDGRADQRKEWYTGFKQENPQLRANHPTFAMNNRIYVANGLRGGVVTAVRPVAGGTAKSVSVSGRDFRFDPRSGVYEAVNGNGQFGMTFDDYGNRFVCSNRNPCRHVVLEGRYLEKNRRLAVSNVMHDVVTPGGVSHVFPISRTWTTSTLHEGQFTAACGVTIYRGDRFGPAFSGNVLVCDPTGNLVHREVLESRGSTFMARPGRKGIEFLASRDEWFRAVNMEVGPDGALYIVDMYRAVIEHPQWVPDELKKRPDNYAGNDRGRIYRIVPRDEVVSGRERTSPQLSRVKTSQLVTLLGHPNAWQRETAARLIYERQDQSVVPSLEQLARQSPSTAGRIHALWALDGLGAVSGPILKAALGSEKPRVSEQALILLETRLDEHPEWMEALDVGSGPTRDERLTFQRVLTLGSHPGWRRDSGRLVRTLTEIAVSAKSDQWLRDAVCLTAGPSSVDLLIAVLAAKQQSKLPVQEDVREVLKLLAETVGAGNMTGDVIRVVERLESFQKAGRQRANGQQVQLACLSGLETGLQRRGRSVSQMPKDAAVFLNTRLMTLWKTAAKGARDPNWPMSRRREAIDVLGFAFDAVGIPVLLELAGGGGHPDIQVAAIRNLVQSSDAKIGQSLITKFETLAPAPRRAVLDLLLSSPSRCQLLLEAIVNKRVKRLREHKDRTVRERARVVLADLVPAARQQVLLAYRPSLAKQGNPIAGRAVFRKHCSACHRVDGIGVDVAPDIGDSRTKTTTQLLTAILDPNRAVDNNFFSYTVVTESGRVLTGILVAETPSTVTLRQQEGKQVSILRGEIEAMKSNGISLMPVGLEKNISVQQMSDLLNFLKNWRYLDGRVPIKVPGTSPR